MTFDLCNIDSITQVKVYVNLTNDITSENNAISMASHHTTEETGTHSQVSCNSQSPGNPCKILIQPFW